MVVRHFRNIIFALAAFLWLPASAHCQLETIPSLAFLPCSLDNQSSHSPCTDNGCCSVEKSQYQTTQLRVVVPVLDSFPIHFEPLLNAANTLPAEVSLGILTAAPPSLLTTWHFASRAALPARAPSLVS